MKIIDILIFYRKNGKYFGHFFDDNKWDIDRFKWFIITDENCREYKKACMNSIIKRNGLKINDFSIFSIKDEKLDKNLKKIVLSEANDMIYMAKSMCNIIGRRIQEDPNREKSWNLIDTSYLKTNKKYVNF